MSAAELRFRSRGTQKIKTEEPRQAEKTERAGVSRAY
jgi:hypothetical protein